MKKLTSLLAVGLIGMGSFGTPLSADDDKVPPGHKKNGVPPGLQKKGGLPPGQAKKKAKYDQPEESVPATPATPATPSAPTSVKAPPPSTPSVPAPATPTQPAPPAPPTPASTTTAKIPEPPKPVTPETPKAPETAKPAQPVSKAVAERRAKLDKHVADLNEIGKSQAARDQMFVRLNNRLNVPLATLDSELKAHPKLGVGGLVLGHYLAKRSKQPVEKIISAHEGGKGWGEIAGEYKVDITELNEQMANAKDSARAAERESPKR